MGRGLLLPPRAGAQGLESLGVLPPLSAQVVRGLSAGARVFELLTLEPSVALRGGGTIPSHSLLGHICFHRVSFR